MSRERKILEVKNLTIGHDSFSPIMKEISVDLYEGEVVCIMGANGVGKSTFLKTISAQIQAISGDVLLDQKSIKDYTPSDLSKKTALVLSHHELAQGVYVDQIFELARAPHSSFLGSLKAKDREQIKQIVKDFDLEHLISRRFDELSDGQKQKVMIARALIQDTDLVLLDEPTTFLDLTNQISTLLTLKKMASVYQKTLLFTSHHWELILELATQVWYFDDQTKELIQTTPEDLILSKKIQEMMGLDVASFDFQQGRFKLAACDAYPVKIGGDDQELLMWTKHHLAKHGFFSSDSSIEIHCRSACEWQLKAPQREDQIFGSLQQLVLELKSLSIEA